MSFLYLMGYLDWLVFHQDSKQSAVKHLLLCTQKPHSVALWFIILTNQRLLPTLLNLHQDKDFKKQTNRQKLHLNNTQLTKQLGAQRKVWIKILLHEQINAPL